MDREPVVVGAEVESLEVDHLAGDLVAEAVDAIGPGGEQGEPGLVAGAIPGQAVGKSDELVVVVAQRRAQHAELGKERRLQRASAEGDGRRATPRPHSGGWGFLHRASCLKTLRRGRRPAHRRPPSRSSARRGSGPGPPRLHRHTFARRRRCSSRTSRRFWSIDRPSHI